MLSIAVALSSFGGVMHSQGEGAILGVFLPTENAFHGPYGDMSFATKN